MRGSPVPLAVSDPITSRWPSVKVEWARASVTCGRPVVVNYTIDAPHDNLDHSLELCLVKTDSESRAESITAVDSVVVPAGSRAGEASFHGSHIAPGRYLVEYRLSAEFARLKLARSTTCRVRVADEPRGAASRVFRIYLSANAGREMAREREQLLAVVLGPLQVLQIMKQMVQQSG